MGQCRLFVRHKAAWKRFWLSTPQFEIVTLTHFFSLCTLFLLVCSRPLRHCTAAPPPPTSSHFTLHHICPVFSLDIVVLHAPGDKVQWLVPISCHFTLPVCIYRAVRPERSSPRYRHSVHAAESDWPGSRRQWRGGPMASSADSRHCRSRPIFRWYPCINPMYESHSISLQWQWTALQMSLYGANAEIFTGILSFCLLTTVAKTAKVIKSLWKFPRMSLYQII